MARSGQSAGGLTVLVKRRVVVIRRGEERPASSSAKTGATMVLHTASTYPKWKKGIDYWQEREQAEHVCSSPENDRLKKAKRTLLEVEFFRLFLCDRKATSTTQCADRRTW